MAETVSAVPAAIVAPAGRRSFRPLLLGGACLALFGVIVVGGVAGGRMAGGSASAIALADIPLDYMQAYQNAAARYGLDWAVLAAIGKVECDHGRSHLAGCNPPGTVNEVGATGPMQFLGPTWRHGTPLKTVPSVGRPTSSAAQGYADDGDGDGMADVWNTADAASGAARLLRANGAPTNYRRAVFAYNHADWYVREVFEIAGRYRDAASVPGPAAGGSGPSVAAVLGNPRIQLTGTQRVDLASGLIDPRVTALLAWLGRSHLLVVTALRSDHSLYTREGTLSNHAFGRAVDIGSVDAAPCHGMRFEPCGMLAVAIAAIAGSLHSNELIYCFDPDGPLSRDAFARADHCDHIHVGYER
jgi:hypothetical protein